MATPLPTFSLGVFYPGLAPTNRKIRTSCNQILGEREQQRRADVCVCLHQAEEAEPIYLGIDDVIRKTLYRNDENAAESLTKPVVKSIVKNRQEARDGRMERDRLVARGAGDDTTAFMNALLNAFEDRGVCFSNADGDAGHSGVFHVRNEVETNPANQSSACERGAIPKSNRVVRFGCWDVNEGDDFHLYSEGETENISQDANTKLLTTECWSKTPTRSSTSGTIPKTRSQTSSSSSSSWMGSRPASRPLPFTTVTSATVQKYSRSDFARNSPGMTKPATAKKKLVDAKWILENFFQDKEVAPPEKSPRMTPHLPSIREERPTTTMTTTPSRMTSRSKATSRPSSRSISRLNSRPSSRTPSRNGRDYPQPSLDDYVSWDES